MCDWGTFPCIVCATPHGYRRHSHLPTVVEWRTSVWLRDLPGIICATPHGYRRHSHLPSVVEWRTGVWLTNIPVHNLCHHSRLEVKFIHPTSIPNIVEWKTSGWLAHILTHNLSHHQRLEEKLTHPLMHYRGVESLSVIEGHFIQQSATQLQQLRGDTPTCTQHYTVGESF